MNRLTHTALFLAGAVVLGGLAWFTTPAPPGFADFSDAGEAFYPDFTDPLAAASLEVIEYDDASGSARPFKVQVKDGRWSIPSHYDYPADGEERLAATASAMIDLKRDFVQSDRVEDHEVLGVIDPLDDATAALVGRGTRVTLRDAAGSALADFVIGRPVEGREGFRYVRLPDHKRVYGVKLDVNLSARFVDWIDARLLEIETADLTRIEVSDYSIDETSGVVQRVGEVVLARDDTSTKWTLADLPPGKTLDTSRVNRMTTALRDLKVTGVRPKPEALSADLRATEALSLDPATRLSLQSKGFFVSRDGRLLSNEGEVSVGTKSGVRYVLRFGEVFYGDGLAVSAGADDDAPDGDAGATGGAGSAGSPNRYLFVTAQFDESLLSPRPEVPPVPEDAVGANLNVLTQDAEAGPGDDEGGASDDAAPSAADEAAAARAAAEAALAAWEERVEAGRARARELNDRFAAWYYVIAGADFDAIRPGLDALVRDETAP